MLHPEKNVDNMGLFDDAIFGSENHLGTFGTETMKVAKWDTAWIKEDELSFESEICKYVPNGGEVVCGEQYLQCEDSKSTIETLRSMKITYLNRAYDLKLLDIWKKWKCDISGPWQFRSLYDYIANHLGYRFWVKDVRISAYGRDKKELTVNISIENVGFANFYQEAEVYLKQVNELGQSKILTIESDTREWNSGSVQNISTNIRAESCRLYLFMRRKSDKRIIYLANNSDSEEEVLLGEIIYPIQSVAK